MPKLAPSARVNAGGSVALADVRISPAAEADLRGIWHYVADDDLEAASRLLRRVRDRISLLASHPLLGPERPDVGPGVRALTVGRYLALYRVTGTGVEIVRVVHGARDVRDLG